MAIRHQRHRWVVRLVQDPRLLSGLAVVMQIKAAILLGIRRNLRLHHRRLTLTGLIFELLYRRHSRNLSPRMLIMM